MDIVDFLENMGLGLTIMTVVFVFLILISFLSILIPNLFMGLLGLLFLVGVILFIGVLIYFIGKFAKEFIKK